MNLGLKGRAALITGAGQGIGKACSLALAEEGCNVAICDVNRHTLKQTTEEIMAKGVEALGVQADITKLEEINDFVAQAAEKFGRIDTLVNNAGAGRLSDLMTLPEEEFRYNMDLMLFGTIRCSKAVVPHMRKGKWGRIINISSIFGKQPGGLLDYDAIKAAVIMFTKDLSNYLAKDNILVNAVCPGPIRTPLWEGPGQLGDQLGKMVSKTSQDAIQWFAEQNIPLGRYGLPEEIANTVTFLASEKASFITGQAINVDGGMVKVCV
ncbi:MAG TPA: SDR family oxidoreductase [Anaerolineales bacterium]|nr:SDR family oxidoreductase [Anaerolineales bacterium]